MEKILSVNKCKVQAKADSDALLEIRDWDYGVLLLSPAQEKEVSTLGSAAMLTF